MMAASLNMQVDALFAEYATPGSPGAAVGIYKSGQIVLARGYGLADLEAGTPITPKTPFHVASVSKQFAAFAVALLAHEGKLDLDADIRQYLPYVPDFGHVITTRQLVQHTSGLRDQWPLFILAGKEMRDVLRQEHVISMVKRQKEFHFEPGTDYLYSNTGYTLLAEIVHAITGKTLRELTTERMFAPLGMNSTFFYDDVREIVPGRANSYEREKDGPWRRSLLSYQTVGATSLLTTIEDLAKWGGNFSTPRVGDAALIDLITRSGTLNDGTSIHYGFGLFDLPLDGRQAICHGGRDAAFHTLFVFYPEHDVAIAVLANTDMDVGAKLKAVANLYLPPVDASARPDKPTRQHKPDAQTLAALAGTYVHPFYSSLTITNRDDKTFARFGNQQEQELSFQEDGSFKTRLLTLRPVIARGGSANALDSISDIGLPGKRYERATAVTSTPAALASYAGDYHSDELDITYTLRVENGGLVASTIWSPKPLPLRQVTATHFDVDSEVVNAFNFLPNAQGQITGARIHTGRAYNTQLRKVTR